MKRRRRWRQLVGLTGAVAGAALALSACGGSTSGATIGTTALPEGTPIKGGVASYSMQVGSDFSWMLPLENEANYNDFDSNVEGDMWRPLYFAGGPGSQTGINYAWSIGERPVYSHGNTEVTVTMHRGWTWSDGMPVTSSDVRFFFELEAAAARSGRMAPYVKGEMPDDIASVSYPNAYQFVVHLKGAYSPTWFTDNQLSWIFPLPRQAWDKTCDSCAVGDNASTPAGAAKVFNYLYTASESLATYTTNPLWKVVDGPWVIKSFDPTTYHTALVANHHYTGPDKPHLAGYQIYSFASNTAEIDALRSGVIDFGWLPFSDYGLVKQFADSGYTVRAWPVFYNEYLEFGYTGPWKALVGQLYIRQALAHVVDQPLDIEKTLDGYGIPDYGVAPDYPGSRLVAPALRTDPYPYSVSAAKTLLSSHGWVRGSNGIDTCQRPGTGADECGAGIPKGKPLTIPVLYETGTPSFDQQLEEFQTAASQAGVDLPIHGYTQNTLYSIGAICPPGPCKWGMVAYNGEMRDFGQFEMLPSGQDMFGTGAFWGGGYDNARAQALLTADQRDFSRGHPLSLRALYASETYLAKDVSGLGWPLPDYEIQVVKNNLRGWYPLNAYANFDVFNWYLVK